MSTMTALDPRDAAREARRAKLARDHEAKLRRQEYTGRARRTRRSPR